MNFNISFTLEAFVIVTSFQSTNKNVSSLEVPLGQLINDRESFWSFANGWQSPRTLFYISIGI